MDNIKDLNKINKYLINFEFRKILKNIFLNIYI